MLDGFAIEAALLTLRSIETEAYFSMLAQRLHAQEQY